MISSVSDEDDDVDEVGELLDELLDELLLLDELVEEFSRRSIVLMDPVGDGDRLAERPGAWRGEGERAGSEGVCARLGGSGDRVSSGDEGSRSSSKSRAK